ncbi:MAG: acyl-CoA synthetase [Burkholderiaceae bacterium]
MSSVAPERVRAIEAWNELDERGSPILIRAIRWIALHLGRRTSRWLLPPIAGYFLLAAPVARRSSRQYLRRLGLRGHWWQVARHIHCFACTILDRVFLLTDRMATLDIHLHGEQALDEALRDGRGCVLIGSHLGSFEVLRALAINRHGRGLKVLMQPEHNRIVTDLLHALNPTVAGSVIPLGGFDSLLRAHEALGRGEIIGMLADRNAPDGARLECDFLGAPAAFPLGPWQAAAALKAPVLLFFGLYSGANRYDIHFEWLADALEAPRRERADTVAGWVERYAERLDHWARRAPYNWFNFYPFWSDRA